MQKAVETAYKAVMKPKEGTILTVAKGAADKAAELSESVEDVEEFARLVIEEAEAVLAKTPDMLPVLKEAGVVDSGGQGLVQVLKGAYDVLTGKEVDYSFEGQKKAEPVKISAQTEAEIKFGYCTEFIIMLDKEFSEKAELEFKAYLESIGDSIVVVSDGEVVKVHVHTNDPGLAIQRALTYGALSNMKIDNMREEHQEKLIKDAEKMALSPKPCVRCSTFNILIFFLFTFCYYLYGTHVLFRQNHYCMLTFSIFSVFRYTCRYAGNKNASAKIHATGLAKHAAGKPNSGTNANPTSVLAAISQTPAKIANLLYPIPWIRKRTILTNASGM